MFFLGEYANMVLMSTLVIVFFFGGWYPNIFFISPVFIFSFKVVLICFLFVLVRAMLPRYRYDQVMSMGWKVLLPLSLSFVVFCASFVVTFSIVAPITINEVVVNDFAEQLFSSLLNNKNGWT
jgi:NADH-quinone oxidoreductase subunit H